MKSEIKTQNISTKKLKFVAEIFLADLRLYMKFINNFLIKIYGNQVQQKKNKICTFVSTLKINKHFVEN